MAYQTLTGDINEASPTDVGLFVNNNIDTLWASVALGHQAIRAICCINTSGNQFNCEISDVSATGLKAQVTSYVSGLGSNSCTGYMNLRLTYV